MAQGVPIIEIGRTRLSIWNGIGEIAPDLASAEFSGDEPADGSIAGHRRAPSLDLEAKHGDGIVILRAIRGALAPAPASRN